MIRDGRALASALYPGQRVTPRSYLARFGYAPPPHKLRTDDVAALPAEVNHGVWIWRCPCGIGSASDPPVGGGVVWYAFRYGFDPRCSNAETGGKWRPIALPDEYREIERLLDLRPDPATRNWSPTETVADLERENAEHGIAEVA